MSDDDAGEDSRDSSNKSCVSGVSARVDIRAPVRDHFRSSYPEICEYLTIFVSLNNIVELTFARTRINKRHFVKQRCRHPLFSSYSFFLACLAFWRGSSRGRRDDATRKMVPWNVSYTAHFLPVSTRRISTATQAATSQPINEGGQSPGAPRSRGSPSELVTSHSHLTRVE